ncbi:unnamed protein product [Chrysoparadoxa australica]
MAKTMRSGLNRLKRGAIHRWWRVVQADREANQQQLIGAFVLCMVLQKGVAKRRVGEALKHWQHVALAHKDKVRGAGLLQRMMRKWVMRRKDRALQMWMMATIVQKALEVEVNSAAAVQRLGRASAKVLSRQTALPKMAAVMKGMAHRLLWRGWAVLAYRSQREKEMSDVVAAINDTCEALQERGGSTFNKSKDTPAGWLKRNLLHMTAVAVRSSSAWESQLHCKDTEIARLNLLLRQSDTESRCGSSRHNGSSWQGEPSDPMALQHLSPPAPASHPLQHQQQPPLPPQLQLQPPALTSAPAPAPQGPESWSDAASRLLQPIDEGLHSFILAFGRGPPDHVWCSATSDQLKVQALLEWAIFLFYSGGAESLSMLQFHALSKKAAEGADGSISSTISPLFFAYAATGPGDGSCGSLCLSFQGFQLSLRDLSVLVHPAAPSHKDSLRMVVFDTLLPELLNHIKPSHSHCPSASQASNRSLGDGEGPPRAGAGDVNDPSQAFCSSAAEDNRSPVEVLASCHDLLAEMYSSVCVSFNGNGRPEATGDLRSMRRVRMLSQMQWTSIISSRGGLSELTDSRMPVESARLERIFASVARRREGMATVPRKVGCKRAKKRGWERAPPNRPPPTTKLRSQSPRKGERRCSRARDGQPRKTSKPTAAKVLVSFAGFEKLLEELSLQLFRGRTSLSEGSKLHEMIMVLSRGSRKRRGAAKGKKSRRSRSSAPRPKAGAGATEAVPAVCRRKALDLLDLSLSATIMCQPGSEEAQFSLAFSVSAPPLPVAFILLQQVPEEGFGASAKDHQVEAGCSASTLVLPLHDARAIWTLEAVLHHPSICAWALTSD